MDRQFAYYSSLWVLILTLFFQGVCSGSNPFSCLSVHFPFQTLCLTLSMQTAEILRLMVKRYSTMASPGSLTPAVVRQTKADIISRIFSVTNYREVSSWGLQDLLKEQSLFLKLREMTGWIPWRRSWMSLFVCWTWSKVRYCSCKAYGSWKVLLLFAFKLVRFFVLFCNRTQTYKPG